MKTAGFVYLNGHIVGAEKASVSPFDRGFLYGDGLLETIRVYDGEPFALDSHIERLAASAAFLRLTVPAMNWTRIIADLLRRNRLTDAWARITLSRGAAARGLDIPKQQSPTILITVGAIDPAIATRQRRGVRLVSVSFCRDPFLAAHKTLNYLPGILAKAAATRAGAYDALFTDARGHVLETTTANVFVWKRTELWTPKHGVLPGVTRALVMKAVKEQGARVRERSFTTSDLTAADEAFVTSSLVEVLPVIAVDGVPIGTGRPGPQTRQLQSVVRHIVDKAMPVL